MPHIPQNKLNSTSLPRQPLGTIKPPMPYLGSSPGEADPAIKKPGKGVRLVSRLNPMHWSYDPDRLVKYMYPKLKLRTDEHTRGLVSDDTPNT
jgi:hypothetical protein